MNTQTIGEIVAKNYRTASVFRNHGIDFCCGGGISLEAACRKKQLDIEKVTRELEEASQGPTSGESYDQWPAGLLIEYIVQTHHAYVRSKLDELSYYAEKVARVHGERHPENVVIRDAFFALAEEMRAHMEDEETVVFPLIKDIVTNRNPESRQRLAPHLTELTREHEVAGSLLALIREASHEFTPPEDACATYRILYKNLADFEADLHKHVHLENNVLFKTPELQSL
jgi:regulator of cell morphogenesis and NO signaling